MIQIITIYDSRLQQFESFQLTGLTCSCEVYNEASADRRIQGTSHSKTLLLESIHAEH